MCHEYMYFVIILYLMMVERKTLLYSICLHMRIQKCKTKIY